MVCGETLYGFHPNKKILQQVDDFNATCHRIFSNKKPQQKTPPLCKTKQVQHHLIYNQHTG